MKKVCATCGTEYERDADYCNVCRTESLLTVESVEPNEGPKRPLREDLFAATVASLTWLIGLGYMIGDLAPREFRPLLVGWVLLTTITIVVGMIVKNVRMFVVFSGIGLLCCVIYAAVKLS